MTATILSGKEPAQEIRALVKERFRRLAARGVVPGLAIVTVGEPPAGNSTRLAKKTARLRITPTTAAVTPTRAAWMRRWSASASMYGAPTKMNMKQNRNVT